MARYKFRMETLLKIRESTRDQRQQELTEAYRADDVLQENLGQVAGEIDRIRALCRQCGQAGPFDVDQVMAAQRYEMLLRSQQGQLQKQRDAVAAEIERRREALVEANRDVRVLEKLREKQEQRHRNAESDRAMKLLDEAAQRRTAEEA